MLLSALAAAEAEGGHPSYVWSIITIVATLHIVAFGFWIYKVVIPEKPIKQDKRDLARSRRGQGTRADGALLWAVGRCMGASMPSSLVTAAQLGGAKLALERGEAEGMSWWVAERCSH
eukprot:CAMPEP_0206230766 /NCGR_PEP_ID=MMETSP0047_2-20121206/10451_1 /ASSEMBLY_ACC=CAM_ASM_000192 /TAXON_ID=195065 /ORGANISM="Chroomonas mesostigmatica_cf, Strain CCMP1168" /LENGTH=117 /DNA_ID=CAMNT_0053654245 /DNA_START=33 /DNA_END=387 /DNA_ORIENTATION=-